MNVSKQNGFTLIEVMIAVVIIAILMSIALPAYQDSVRKSRRADATAELEKLAARQERWFTERNSYTNVLANLAGPGVTTSPNGHYRISMTNLDCLAGGSYSCFELTAAAVGDQAGDQKCATFTLNEIGRRGFTGTGGTARDCW